MNGYEIVHEETVEDIKVGIMRNDRGSLYVFTKEPQRPGMPGDRVTMSLLSTYANTADTLKDTKREVRHRIYKRLRLVVERIESERA